MLPLKKPEVEVYVCIESPNFNLILINSELIPAINSVDPFEYNKS